MVHYAGYIRGFTPRTFTPSVTRRGRRGLADRLRRPSPITRRSRPSCPSPAKTGPGAIRTPIRTAHTPSGGNGDLFLQGAPQRWASTCGSVRLPSPTGRFGNRPHCIYRGFCLQGCKVNAKASPLITHVPDALAHGAEIRPDAHVARVLCSMTGPGGPIGVEYFRDGGRAPAAGRGSWW